MKTFLKSAPGGMTEPKPRSKRRTVATAAVFLVFFMVASLLIGPRLLPEINVWVSRSVVLTLLVASSGSIICWRKLSVRLGPTTSFAALAMVWGAALALLVASLPKCPGVDGTERCGITEVVSYGAIGMLFVVSVAAFVIPPMLLGKAGKATYRWNSRRITSRLTRIAEASNRKKNKQGVSSKAHERGQDKSAFQTHHKQTPSKVSASKKPAATTAKSASTAPTKAAPTKRRRASGSGKFIDE